ncbi:hypothetical protein M885DRAFT_532722 [Pelagophyceae sp. CCMP2097]|nr:hypothetical protein M885DRAFT_532722 [Pelagophyceae sp. CCMP2097]
MADGAAEPRAPPSDAELRLAARAKYAALYPPHGSPPLLFRAWQWLLLVTLAPVKVLLVMLIFSLAALWCYVCTLGVKVWDSAAREPLPLPPRRRRLVETGVRALSWCALCVLGVVVTVRGREHCPKRGAAAYTIVANHVSMLDAIYVTAALCPCFLCKADLRSWPIVGYLATTLQCIFVNRETVAQDFGSATNRLLQRQQVGGSHICCFPEGTTANDRYLLAFRSGAFVAGRTVHPVVLRYPFQFVSPMYAETAPGTILKLAAALWWRLDVKYLPPYEPSSAERADPKRFADNVRRVMAAAMDDPPVECCDVTNDELHKFWFQTVVEKRPLAECISPDDVRKYAHKEPHLMLPTRLARRESNRRVHPAPRATTANADASKDAGVSANAHVVQMHSADAEPGTGTAPPSPVGDRRETVASAEP